MSQPGPAEGHGLHSPPGRSPDMSMTVEVDHGMGFGGEEGAESADEYGMDIKYDEELEMALYAAESQSQAPTQAQAVSDLEMLDQAGISAESQPDPAQPKVEAEAGEDVRRDMIDIEDLATGLPGQVREFIGQEMNGQVEEGATGASEEGAAGGQQEVERLSPFHQFRKKGFLSVSDLVGPIWCETQYDYRLRTLPFLPPEKRPDKIVSTAGKEIVVDKIKVEGKERILRRGEKIHKRLEREIHPEEVAVKANTREDVWGLRFLNMLSAVEALLTLNKCREMPVVGFVNGVMIMGIIDEITREPLDPTSAAPATRSSRSTQTALTSFFSPTKARSSQPEREVRLKTHRLLISDSKTRAAGTVPREEDTLSGRLQVMMYKELLDAILLSPTSSQPQSQSQSPSQTQISNLSVLPSRHPFSWDMVFDHLSLNASTSFSDEFVIQSRAVIYGNGLRHGTGDARTLEDMKTVWERYVVDLGLGVETVSTSSRNLSSSSGSTLVKGKGKGKEKESGKDNVGRTEDQLQLVYRRAEGKKKVRKEGGEHKSKRRRRRTKVDSELKREAEEEPPPPASLRQSSLPPETSMPLLAESRTPKNEEEEEERQVQLAILESLKDPTAVVDTGNGATVTALDNQETPSIDSRSTPTPTTSRPPTRQSERLYWSDNKSDEDQEEDELAFAVELSLNPDLEREEAEAAGVGEEGDAVVVRTSSQRTVEPDLDSDLTILADSGGKKVDNGGRDDQPEFVESSPSLPPTTTTFINSNSRTRSRPSSTTKPTPSFPDTNTTSKSKANSKTSSGSIIGTSTFRHSPLLLASHLESVFGFWMGEREPIGVTLEQTRRCGWCEFEEGCEWRAKKAEEIWNARRK